MQAMYALQLTPASQLNSDGLHQLIVRQALAVAFEFDREGFG
jgi:hypothetical protein